MSDLISRQAAIDTEGLDAEIRCEMCTNPMHTDRGCDGHCEYDEKLYEKIMQVLDERIKPLPSARPENIRCAECKWFQCNMRQDGYLPKGVDEFECRHWCGYCDPTDFCSYAERRTDE